LAMNSPGWHSPEPVDWAAWKECGTASRAPTLPTSGRILTLLREMNSVFLVGFVALRQNLFSAVAARANGERTSKSAGRLGSEGFLRFPSADLQWRRSCGINPAPLSYLAMRANTYLRQIRRLRWRKPSTGYSPKGFPTSFLRGVIPSAQRGRVVAAQRPLPEAVTECVPDFISPTISLDGPPPVSQDSGPS
jgi:hypothetical protein